MTPVNPGFDLQREEDEMCVVLDVRSKNGNEDLRIDHHAGGVIKESDIIDIDAPSCAGLVAEVFDVQLHPEVLMELNNLDSGNPTKFNWDQAEKKLSSNLSQGIFEDWNQFKNIMSDVGIIPFEIKDLEVPGPINGTETVRLFGNWDMSGDMTDKYVGYFINVEYPKGNPFTVVGRMRTDKKPAEPYQIFMANSPTKKNINIGVIIEQMKQQFGPFNGGGRQDVGGCNFANEEEAQKIYEAILRIIG